MLKFARFIFLAVILLGTALQDAQAQENLTLRQAIDLALERNIQLRQAALNMGLAEADVWQARGNYLPALNGFASHTWNYGRTIDPFTNQFATNAVQSQNFGLNSSLDIFAGFQNYHSLKKAGYDLQAGKADLEKARNDVMMAVISAYMQALFSRSLVDVAQEQLELTKLQEERVTKLVNAGALAEGALLDIRSMQASDQLQLISAENNYRMAMINLRQLLEISAEEPFSLAATDTLTEPAAIPYSAQSLYQTAVSNLPEIRSAEFRARAAKSSLSIARGMQSPRISLSAGIGTGYSELRKDIVGAPTLNGFDTLGVTTGSEYVLFPNYSYNYETIPFNQQVEDNLNRTVSLNLTLPILNGFAVRTNISRSKIAMQNADLNLLQSKRNLEKEVEQAYADATGSFARYQSAREALTAAERSLAYMEQRFNLGAANTFEYREARTRVVQAESELLRARYEYFFKKGILDFYFNNQLNF